MYVCVIFSAKEQSSYNAAYDHRGDAVAHTHTHTHPIRFFPLQREGLGTCACVVADMCELIDMHTLRYTHALQMLLCANPLVRLSPLLHCSEMANMEHVGDLSILRTKATINAIAAALNAEKKGAKEADVVVADDVRVEVTSADTDLAKSDVASVLLQLTYALFALGLVAATWLDLSPQSAKSTNDMRGIVEAPESAPSTSTAAVTITRPSKLHLLFQCFSLPLNYAKLRKVPPKTETDCLNGLRVLTMFWIIAGHTMLMPAAIAGYDNEGDLIASWGYRGTYVLQAILGAEVGVDTFFFLSGYLATRLTPHIAAIHNTFASGRRGKLARAFPLTVTTCLAVAKRYLRLTPSLLFVMFIYYKILPFYGAGPFVGTYENLYVSTCEQAF